MRCLAPGWKMMALAAVAFAVALLTTTAAISAENTINVLVFDGQKIDERLAGELKKDGIQFVYSDISEAISDEMLKQFHVVLINQAYQISINFQNPGLYFNAKENIVRLLRYAESGGALFLGVPVPGLSTELGVENKELSIRDDAHLWSQPVPNTDLKAEYAWTTAIAKHEATKGVSRIFYPVEQGRWDDMYAATAFKLSKDWIPLVSSMETSTVSRGFFSPNWEIVEKKVSPIAAVRPFGEGRVAFMALNPYFTFLAPYAPPATTGIAEFFVGRIDGIFLEKGDGKDPSQGRVLLVNMLKWLAASGQSKGFGTYTPDSYAKLPKASPAKIPDWIRMGWNEKTSGAWYKTLIGVKTAFSDGKGTVAEYAAEARKLGITILGITETMEKFDPANWNRFKEECRKASNENLKVVHGLDLADPYGNRFIVLNNDAFPPSSLTTVGSKVLAATHYLSIRMGENAITIAHRLTSSPIVHQLVKHFQGISLYTYRNGKLEDNSYPAYEWEAFRFSTPIPFVIHETYSPEALALEDSTGYQMSVFADTPKDAAWYLVGTHGMSHFWEAPIKVQVSNGPRLLTFGQGQFLKVSSDVPITEVRVIENYNLYRRWTPKTNEFTVESLPLPKAHWAWYIVIATDAKGRTVVSPPSYSGQAGSFAWRCSDRQNWLQGGPDIYTGWLVSDFNIAVPAFGTDEGMPSYYGYPDMNGPQRGDNMCPMMDFPFSGPMVQVQDIDVDQRYYRATWDDIAGDAKPAHVTSRSRVYAAKLRYLQFFEDKKELPRFKSVTLRLRRPLDTTTAGDVFPIFAGLKTQWVDSGGDMSYAFVDPKSKKLSTAS